VSHTAVAMVTVGFGLCVAHTPFRGYD